MHKHFTTANQLAGQAGRGALALDAGVQMGEMLLTSRQLSCTSPDSSSANAQGLKAEPQNV